MFNKIKTYFSELKKKKDEKKGRVLAEQNRKALFAKFQDLYLFVSQLDKTFPNRHARKQFWKGFIENKGELRESVMMNMINRTRARAEEYFVDKNNVTLNEMKLDYLLTKQGVAEEVKKNIVSILKNIKIKDVV